MGARREADASSGGSADVGAIVVLVVYHAIVEWKESHVDHSMAVLGLIAGVISAIPRLLRRVGEILQVQDCRAT